MRLVEFNDLFEAFDNTYNLLRELIKSRLI